MCYCAVQILSSYALVSCAVVMHSYALVSCAVVRLLLVFSCYKLIDWCGIEVHLR